MMPLPSEHTYSWIDTIPTEIWDNIFISAVSSGVIDASFQGALDTSLALSQTCSRWRGIALSRPLLWSAVLVQFRGERQTPNSDFLDLIMERTPNIPLSVDLRMIDVNETIFDDPTSAASAVMSRFLEHTPRWREVKVFVRGCCLPMTIWNRLSTTGLPLLESLQLDVRLENGHSDKLLHGSFLYSNSPRLRRVLLSTSNHQTSLTRQLPLGTPHAQLTSLHIHTHMSPFVSISIWLVVDLLHKSPNLVSCVFSHIYACRFTSKSRTEPPVRMHRLEYLHLALRGPSPERTTSSEIPLTVVLNHIDAPALKTIAFTHLDLWGQVEFERFIARSRCPLEEIHFFKPRNFDSNILLPILRGIPSIEGLHLGCIQNLLDDPEFVGDMIAWNAGASEFDLCPALSWLSFRDPTSFDIAPDAYLDAHAVQALSAILTVRLNPPNEGEKRFERVYLPVGELKPYSYGRIRELCGEPYSLDVQFDDGEMYDIHSLWERYGDR